MKNFKKIISVLLVSLLAFAPVTAALLPGAAPTAEASPIDGDNILGFLESIGIDVEELKGLSGTEIFAKIIGALKDSSKIESFFPGGKSIAEIVKEIMEYFGSFDPPTRKPEEPTTEKPTEPSTEAPAPTAPPAPVYPPYNPPPYNPPPYVPPATTEPEEPTTFTYIPPEQIYTEVYTTTPFRPEVQEDDSEKDSSPFKTVLGVILLIGSFVAVVVIAVKLKKSNI